jgi:hypothetical protein
MRAFWFYQRLFYSMPMQPNLFAAETNSDKLYQLNGFLKRFAADVDWAVFD